MATTTKISSSVTTTAIEEIEEVATRTAPGAKRTPRASSPIGPLRQWKFGELPQGNRLLPRQALFAKFEDALGKRHHMGRVLLVTAPAGYGKTTAMAQWAATTAMPVRWYHLDQSDDDPVVFIHGLVMALRERPAHTRWEVERLLRHMHTSTLSPSDLQRAVATLIADIQGHIKKPLALLLTGASALTPDGAASAVLAQLVVREPDELRLAIETREPLHFDSETDLIFTRLLTQHRVAGIDLDDLRLDDDEFAALLSLFDFHDDPQHIERLRTLSDGWITGMLLGMGALLPANMQSISSEEADRERIFQYLTHEVILRLPQPLRDFAMQAAVLPVMTAALCEQLLGRTDGRACLVALEQHSGFTTRLGRRPAEAYYQFQPFFRQALLNQMEKAPDGIERRRQLHKRAGTLLASRGDVEQAIEQYAEAGCFEQVIALIEANRAAWLRAGKGATLAKWIGLLPESLRQHTPHLLVLLAEIRYQEGNRDLAAALIAPLAAQQPSSASSLSSLSNVPDEMLARAHIIQGSVAFHEGKYHEALACSEQAQQLTLTDADEPHINAGLLQVATLHLLGEVAGATTVLDEVEQRARSYGDRWALARVLYQRSKLCMTAGEYDRAKQAASAALACAQEAHDEIIVVNSHLNLGAMAEHAIQFRAAREHFEVALTLAEGAGYELGRAYALANLADMDLRGAAYDGAIAGYQRALCLPAVTNDAYLRGWGLANLGYAFTCSNRASEAIDLLETTLAKLAASEQPINKSVLLISLGFAYLRAQRLTKAETALHEARNIAQASGANAEYARASLQSAALHLAQGNSVAAGTALGEALDWITPHDSVAPLVFETQLLPELRPLLQQSAHSMARLLLNALAGVPNATKEPVARYSKSIQISDDLDDTDEGTISVYALGEPRVLVGGTPVTSWGMLRARELLYFLLDRNELVTKETILDALWEDVDLDKSDAGFKAIRNRLKRALGRDCLKQINGRWQLSIECWSDAREFQRSFTQGVRLLEAGHLHEALQAFEQALMYWSGDYLDDFFSSWALLRREALHNMYLDCLEHRASLELRLKRGKEAAKHYHALLEAEPLRESAHRGLMRSLAMQGEYRAAVQQYRSCLEQLRESGMQPETKTTALYQQMRAKIAKNGAAETTAETRETRETMGHRYVRRPIQNVAMRAFYA